jgi:L-arabinose isomerase
MTEPLATPRRRRQTRIGLVAGGLAAYWPQFPELLPQLKESSAYVTSRFAELDAETIDVGFVSDAQEAAVAAEKLRQADCDLIVIFLTTYLTSSMVLPIAQRAKTPAGGSPIAVSALCLRSPTCSSAPASSSAASRVI